MVNRAPLSLKVFLTTIAVVDDLIAIVIIALFYTSKLSVLALSVSGVCFLILIAMNRMGVTRFVGYFFIGTVMWISVLKSGVHATLAGVALGFTIPFAGSKTDPDVKSPLLFLEHRLHPWVSLAILPIFAFANAGLSFAGFSLDLLKSGVCMGITVGLGLGKPIGVFGIAALLILAKVARLPEGSTWLSLLGTACLTGIGFTMSLFIGGLAFEGYGAHYENLTKVGVFAGSIISFVFGYICLSIGLPKKKKS